MSLAVLATFKAALVAILLGASCGAAAQSLKRKSPPPSVPTFSTASLGRHGFFYVGGKYAGALGEEVMRGSMYVEVLVPRKIRRIYPLVLFHGAGQTAVNWLGTPDGRKGWADYFVEQGYVVYMVDQPARGRSAYHPEMDGALKNFPAPLLEKRFTDTEELGDWPQAKKHSQWPGDGPLKGRMGDPVFDAFDATQVEFLRSNAETQTLVQAAGAQLLDRIGPAILLTHSQAGAFGWLLADVRPKLVKAIVAVEPTGPPLEDVVVAQGKARLWGVTDIPIHYEPPIQDQAELLAVRQAQPDAKDLLQCWRQIEPARQLVNLRDIPVLITVGDASYHAMYDHCTSQYLTQAGVKNTFMRLADHGIHGNGHMVMLEKNNLEVAKLLDAWMRQNVH